MAWEGLNRRRFPRAHFPCLIKLVHDGADSEAMLTHTENISTGGVCVIIRKPAELFSSIGLEIDLVDGEEHIICRGKVAWSVRRKATEDVKPSWYDIGVEFVDLRDEDRVRLEQAVIQLTKYTGKAAMA